MTHDVNPATAHEQNRVHSEACFQGNQIPEHTTKYFVCFEQCLAKYFGQIQEVTRSIQETQYLWQLDPVNLLIRK